MAIVLGKDLDTYTRERDGFLRDLQHFHESRGTPFRRVPKIGGHEIDLYLLYSLVTTQGGWIKVNYKNAWTGLFEFLRIPQNTVNASVALKQIYLRYLDRWEKVHFLGEEADRGSDDDEESRHKRWSARSLHSVPLSYNYGQHNIAEAARDYNHLSTELYKASDYDRLALSLISPLPNEQDFAINVCTLLSNDGKHTLKLEKHPRILNYLLAHAGVFNHSSLRKLIADSYINIRKQNVSAFWKETLESDEFLDLTDETLFTIKNSLLKRVEAHANVSCSDHVPMLDVTDEDAAEVGEEDVETLSDSDDSDLELFEGVDCVINNIPKGRGFKLKFKADADDRGLFNLGRNVGTRDYMGQRVLQVATILRNLSFIDENVPSLVQNRTFLRFILLCASSRWNQLMNLGLDMLGNMATEFLVKDLLHDKVASSLLKIISNGLQTEDRNWCITALEVLNKLSQNEKNEDALLRHLEADVYKRVCSFLTIHDVMLLIYTLECLYSLSSLGERSCNYISENFGVIDTLVSLVTVEGKSYGPKACIGMKLVETVTGGNSGASVAAAQTTVTVPASTTTSLTTVAAVNVATSVATPSAPTATPVTQSTTPLKVMIGQPSTPQRQVHIAPQRLITISPAPTFTKCQPMSNTSTPLTQVNQVINPQQLVQQQHAHQQAIQENEQFALTWLRATYEPCGNGKVDHQELYKHYINCCAKIGRRGVIAPLHFPRCVRSVFGGTVGPNAMKSSNNSSETAAQYYEGIKVRAQPLVINVQHTTITTIPITSPTTTTNPLKAVRRKIHPIVPLTTITTTATPPITTSSVPAVAEAAAVEMPPSSPASPILKAQLSAPPKPREATTPTKADVLLKSQVMAHPHLSQALLGSGCASAAAGSSKDQQQGQSNTSLIKSLLATKVNECMPPVSMRTDCQSVSAQVAARQQQQRLLAQQIQQTAQLPEHKSVVKVETPKNLRPNGARQLFSEIELADPAVSSTTQGLLNSAKNRREPPQPPPPLAPLSNNKANRLKIDNEDSDSIGNNSLASSTGMGNVGVGGVSSTEDGDGNSLTSFEGLLNGIQSIDNANDDSNSKDSIKLNTIIKKPLMLADLLEKKVDKDPPAMNGMLGKELRIGDKGLELVDNHKINKDANENTEESTQPVENKLKRSASDDVVESEPKKPHLVNNINGTADSPVPPDSVTSSNGDETNVTASTAAAKLFADLAADILEDEEEEELQEQQAQQLQQQQQQPVVAQQPQYVENNQQVLIQPRQMIVQQNQLVKTTSGQTVIVQNSGHQQPQRLNTGQLVLSQNLQGQMQLVASGQPGQYVISTGGGQGYVVAQPQTAVVHGQQQTVLVAQTHQQQGTGTKTIIILQQQNHPNHQKMVVTPQGQQMVVTQVQRPILQQSTVSNITPISTVIKTTTAGGNVITHANGVPTTASTNILQHQHLVIEKKVEPVVVKPKIVRDLTTPFVCEWEECQPDVKFTSANQVFMHVCATHVAVDTTEELTCKWDRCDTMKRKRFSLMTHLNDKHCNTEAMRASLIKRKQIHQSGKTDPPAPAPPVQHPGYAPDAAFHAIKRHALEFVNPKELQRTAVVQGNTIVSVSRTGPPPDQDDNEGPVTKSIRLTASLILRNLVIYSSSCRRYLKSYEPHLANVALSNVESSRTIAQVLYDLNDCSSHR